MATITVSPTDGYPGFVWITVHLDYGLKKQGDYEQYSTVLGNDALDTAGTLDIDDNNEYAFSVDGPFDDSDSVYNLNVFKNDPGFLVIVFDSSDTPIEGVEAIIQGLASGVTDEDGCFFYEYKHKGKGQCYTVTLPIYGVSESVLLKANKFVIIPFVVF